MFNLVESSNHLCIPESPYRLNRAEARRKFESCDLCGFPSLIRMEQEQNVPRLFDKFESASRGFEKFDLYLRVFWEPLLTLQDSPNKTSHHEI